VDDADVLRLMKMVTFVPMDEIRAMEKWEGAELNQAKARLAFEVTKLVHGEEAATKAKQTAEGLFGGAGSADMPSTELLLSDLADEVLLLDIMLEAKLIPSKGEGRRLITQGGVSVDDVKITEPNFMVTKDSLQTGIVIKKGKKVYHKVVAK
jgi:tyrosyl-tRNA synthetase